MPWYAVERCDLCGAELDKEHGCPKCNALEAALPGVIEWMNSILDREKLRHQLAHMRPKRLAPKPPSKK